MRAQYFWRLGVALSATAALGVEGSDLPTALLTCPQLGLPTALLTCPTPRRSKVLCAHSTFCDSRKRSGPATRRRRLRRPAARRVTITSNARHPRPVGKTRQVREMSSGGIRRAGRSRLSRLGSGPVARACISRLAAKLASRRSSPRGEARLAASDDHATLAPCFLANSSRPILSTVRRSPVVSLRVT